MMALIIKKCWMVGMYRTLKIHTVWGRLFVKKKGVQCCTTPFFILLDAHMRFYQTDWVQLITEELEHNGRQITCCQTKPLTKIDGIVQEKEPYSTYGAFCLHGGKAIYAYICLEFES